ncbi:Uncharacterised protein [Achromobacter sp. 2789STDY5608615]|nr:Uncharacterised protein [Achromobacter sp. 2789STDY5608615]
MALPGAQVVDGLHQAGAVGAEGMAGQRARIVETQVARRVLQRHVDQVAAAVKVGVAVLVVADPAGAVRRFQRHRGAAVAAAAAVQKVAAAIPQQHVGQRHVQPLGQPLQFVPQGGQGGPGLFAQLVQVRVAAPGAQRLPGGALVQVGRHQRTGQLAQRRADLAPVAGDAYILVGHGDSPGCHADCNFSKLSAVGTDALTCPVSCSGDPGVARASCSN